jgi:hypothetical protein
LIYYSFFIYIKKVNDSIRLLGVPIGSSDFVNSFLKKEKDKIINIIKSVSDMIDWENSQIDNDLNSAHHVSKSSFYSRPAKQVGLILLRYIFNSRLSFLLRNCTPDEMNLVIDDIELFFKKTFISSFQLPPLSDSAWKQVFLPIHFGGLGFVPLHELSKIAFAASSNTFFNHNANTIFPNFDSSSFLSSSSFLASAYTQASALVLQVVSASASSSDSSAPPLSRDSLRQHHIAEFCSRARRDNFLSNLQDPVDKVRMSSLSSSPSTTAWLHAFPSTPDLLVSSRLFPICLCNLLGLPFPFRLPLHCLCGSPLDYMGYHLTTCKYRNPMMAHNLLCDLLCTLARNAGHHTSGTSQLLHLNPQNNEVADFRISSSSSSDRDIIVGRN